MRKVHTRKRGIVGQNRYKSDVLNIIALRRPESMASERPSGTLNRMWAGAIQREGKRWGQEAPGARLDPDWE